MVRWRWCWCWSLVLVGCTKPNPAFMPGLVDGSTSEADTSGSESMSGSTSEATTSDTTSDVSATTTDATTSTSTTTDTTATTTTTSTTTDPMTSSTTEPATSSTTEMPSEQELCDAAVDDPKATVVLDLYATWCEDTTLWGYALALADSYVPTVCNIQDPKTAVILDPASAKTTVDVAFGPSLLTGPWNGAEGVVQGVFTSIDLAGVAHPCFFTRIARPLDDAAQPLTAQVIAREVGLEDDLVLVDEVLPIDGHLDVSVPIPPELHDKAVEVVLVTIKKDVEAGSQPRVLWERPRLVDAPP
ncbi:MAG: hypothetical protein R3B09_02950 [Nannocystaceae bacterium]